MQNNYINNARVLVTGGAGFIGSNIIEKLLNQNNIVFCFDNLETGKYKNIERFVDNKSFIFLNEDIRDKQACLKACQNIDIVLHQAALGSVPRSIKDPIATNNVNIDGFINILVAAKENNVKRLVFASSSSVYGDAKDLPKIEEKIGNQLSPYAVTKYANELYAKVFSELYGMEIIGLRYFNVFGKNQDPDSTYSAVIPKFIKLLLDYQAPIIHGDGMQSRDFTYIDNVVLANELAATTTNKNAINNVYNVACGKSNNLNDITQDLITELARFDEKIKTITPIYVPERQGDIKDSLASIEKAKNLLNYNPKYFFNEGLKLTAKWYFDNYR